MQKLSRLLLFLPLLALMLVYAKYAVSGLLLNQECYGIVRSLGLGEPLTSLLVRFIFPLDGTVALLLLLGNRFRRFPWHVLFLWAGLWPWVPRLLQWYGGLSIEYGEAAGVSLLAALAYYLYRTQGIVFFANTKNRRGARGQKRKH